MLQFKAPEVYSKPGSEYTFLINDAQHRNLKRLADEQYTSLKRDAVYYVFPLYSKWSKVIKDAPCLLKDTWLFPVRCVSLNEKSSPPNPNRQIPLKIISSKGRWAPTLPAAKPQ